MTTFTVYMTDSDLKKSLGFDRTIEITDQVRFPTYV